jgi:hypothetical protein
VSTDQQIHNETNPHSFETINAHVNGLDLAEVTAPAAMQQTAVERTQRLISGYAAARPILVAVVAIPFIPANWRAVITALVITLDEVTAAFKAGKDLGAGSAPSTQMEPKLPVG